ncbi:MAG: hypothetical protein CMJ32_05845 [Phycisphaerae bacterium]|nr:hypothetical protein [Phycisphaerae bacterium]
MSKDTVARTGRRAFSLVEIITVVGVIVVLVAILLPAIGVVSSNADWASSQNNMKQVFTYMKMYSTDNREFVPPSRFDYTTSSYKGKVRSASPPGSIPNVGDLHEGTWADTLWTISGLGPVLLPDTVDNTTEWNYRYDAPDSVFYRSFPDYENPFRSQVANSRNTFQNESTGTGGPELPYGPGANHKGDPGYFAANNFFDSRNGNWYTFAQIRREAESLYLVDSYAGEVIEPDSTGFGDANSQTESQVDFRYAGDVAIMLMMDGHVRSEPPWEDLDELEQDRRIRVRNLDKR